MEKTMSEMLKAIGWTVVCLSPFELGHDDGSIATGRAAQAVMREAEEEYKKTQRIDYEVVDGMIREAYEFFGGIGPNNKDELEELIGQLNEIKSLMK